jgi:hypothetical protein
MAAGVQPCNIHRRRRDAARKDAVGDAIAAHRDKLLGSL